MTLIDSQSHFRVPTFDVHDRLAKAREEAHITQTRMAELLGCSRRTIVRYESDGTPVPRSVLLAYHVATQTDLSWIEFGVRTEDNPFLEPRAAYSNPKYSGPVGPTGIEPVHSTVKAGRLVVLPSRGAPKKQEAA
jgi:transcriptional regulator with XRE-family HTH domain